MANNYSFYLGEIRLPVNPSKYTCKYSNKNKTETLINNGEINILKSPGLTEFSFDIVLPQQEYPFAHYETGFQEAQYFLAQFAAMKEKNAPFSFKVLRGSPDGTKYFDTLSLKCTLEGFSYVEDAAKGFDITATVTLKQYRDYATMKLIPNKDGTATTIKERPVSEEKKAEIPSPANPKTYTIKPGDNLWMICKREYGDGNKYREIAAANGIVNPNKIYPGQVITLE